MKFLNSIFVFGITLMVSQPAMAEELQIKRLIPPISTSSYSSYNENDSGQIRREFKLNGRKRAYQLYAPTFSRKPRAVLILLHGSGRTGVSLVEKWRPIANRNNLILIGPHGTDKKWNLRKDGSEYLLGILKDVEQDHVIDKSRIYLFGHSAGGIAALYMSITHSDIFAAASVHAGMFKNPEHYDLINNAKRKIPMIFINGTRDKLFPIEEVRSSANAFASRGHETSLQIIAGHNHWYYDLSNFINKQAWDFLSQHRL